MDQFLSKLLDKYGLARIIIAVLIGFTGLWALAHFTAAPGGNVSVLWGLAQYTKSKPDTSSVIHSTPIVEPAKQQQNFSLHQEMPKEPAEIPADLGVIHGITAKTSDQTLKSLRAKRQLRPLEALESGRPVTATPRGTYFFIFGPALRERQGRMIENLDAQKASRFRDTEADFEIHLLKVGPPIIIGFATESDAIRVGGPTPEIQKIAISPAPWEKMTSLLYLPANRIAMVEPRTISLSEKTPIYILDCQIR